MISLVVIAVAYALVLPRIASYTAVWKELRTLSWPWLVGLGAATVLNNLTLAPPLMVVVRGLKPIRAVRLTQTSTAVSLALPGGATVGMAAVFAMLRSWGVSRAEAGRAIAVAGLWSQGAVLIFPIVAVAVLAVDHRGSTILYAAAAAAGLICLTIVSAAAAVAARPGAAERVLSRLDRLLARARRVGGRAPSWDAAGLIRFRADTAELIRRRWVALSVATALNQLSGFLVLDLCLRAVGVGAAEISVSESFAAWSTGRLISSLPTTPGGVGLVELSLTGILVGFGGHNARVIAAVLLYRALVIVPTLVAGTIAGAAAVLWRADRVGGSPGS